MRANSTDELYIEAPPEVVARALVECGNDASWWLRARTSGEYGLVRVVASPGRLRPRVRFQAGIGTFREGEGFTWHLEQGELRGRAEWWFEQFKDGTIVHYYLDVERGDRGRARRMSSLVRRHRWAIRRGLNGLKDSLERRATSRR